MLSIAVLIYTSNCEARVRSYRPGTLTRDLAAMLLCLLEVVFEREGILGAKRLSKVAGFDIPGTAKQASLRRSLCHITATDFLYGSATTQVPLR